MNQDLTTPFELEKGLGIHSKKILYQEFDSFEEMAISEGTKKDASITILNGFIE